MKKRNIIILAIVIIAVAFTQFSCKPIAYYLQMVNKVHGNVTDAETGEPIGSVEVFISTYQYSDLTNFFGDYELELADGTWDIEFTKEGYETQIIEVTCDETEGRIRLDVAMEAVYVPPDGPFISGTISNPYFPGLMASQETPLYLYFLDGDDENYRYVSQKIPSDDMIYPFPYDYATQVYSYGCYEPIFSFLDMDNSGFVSSGDFFGIGEYSFDSLYVTDTDVTGVDMELGMQFGEGTVGVILHNAEALAGERLLLAVSQVKPTNIYQPGVFLGGDGIIVAESSAATLTARELIDYETLAFGDHLIVDGLVHVSLYIDLPPYGYPPSSSDPFFEELVIMFGGDEQIEVEDPGMFSPYNK